MICDLTGTAVLRLDGKDARRFSNGMFTNNVRDLPSDGGNRSAMCDAKGKVGGLLDLYCLSDTSFLLVLDGVSADEFAARYDKFIVFDDVEIVDLTATTAVLTVQGENAADVLASAGLPLPTLTHAQRGGMHVVRRDRTSAGGFDVIGSRDALAGLDLGARSPMSELEILRVEAGKPRWPVDVPGRALVAELGLRDEVCHFEKGCYVGQETIHRLDVMGQARKVLAGVRVSGEVATGAEIRADGQAIGTLTSPVHSPRFGVIGLAILRKPFDDPGTRVQVVDGDHVWDGIVDALPFRG